LSSQKAKKLKKPTFKGIIGKNQKRLPNISGFQFMTTRLCTKSLEISQWALGR
jgi:hypothetical protein